MTSKYKVTIHNDKEIPLKLTKFAGGEWQVQLEVTSDLKMAKFCVIRADIKDGEIMPLALITDAIRAAVPAVPLYLCMPYLPYARQDRRMGEGQALSVKVFANFINSLNFREVDIANCHSDVGIALLERVKNFPISQPEFMPVVDALIAPDFGATKKTHDAAKRWGIKEVIQAGKMRDVGTGELSDPIIFGNVHGKDVLVIDDICDGGRTFLQLATALKEAGANNLYLHVTHGIFSYGAKEKLREAGYYVTATYDWTE
ncbi:ribose-phosphate pyrophosphokinase [Aeromonas phage Akh-2]|nr:ribose-phosphate pyrophosphokinase [Aeromonas phage Akh-2]